MTGESPPLPVQAQLGLQQSQNRVANPSVPLVGGVHVPELLELDELELEAPLELLALDELAAVSPLELLLAPDVPVSPPTPEELVLPLAVLPALTPPPVPPLPLDASFDVLPASHDTA